MLCEICQSNIGKLYGIHQKLDISILTLVLTFIWKLTSDCQNFTVADVNKLPEIFQLFLSTRPPRRFWKALKQMDKCLGTYDNSVQVKAKKEYSSG